MSEEKQAFKMNCNFEEKIYFLAYDPQLSGEPSPVINVIGSKTLVPRLGDFLIAENLDPALLFRFVQIDMLGPSIFHAKACFVSVVKGDDN